MYDNVMVCLINSIEHQTQRPNSAVASFLANGVQLSDASDTFRLSGDGMINVIKPGTAKNCPEIKNHWLK